jgi:sugar diacid utilization regulator
MQKDKLIRNTKGLTHEYLILDLIQGRIQDPLLIEERVKKSKWDLNENLYVLTVVVNNNVQADISILNKTRDTLQNMISNSKSIIYYDYIIIVITRNKEIPLSKEELESLTDYFEVNNIHAGLSRRFNHLKNISQYYSQSLKAIELGLHMNKGSLIFLYEDYAVFHMLDICSRQADIRDFCHPALLRLMEYDRLNNTCYTFTIYVYLKHKCNHKNTVDELHIYPTTLIYRISKIKNIIHADLDDAEFLFQLSLAFKILEYTNEMQIIAESYISSNSTLK